MGTALIPNALSTRRLACVICVADGPRNFGDVELLRERTALLVKMRQLFPVLIEQKIVDCPREFLSARERSLQTTVLQAIEEHHYRQVWIVGTRINEFAREAVNACQRGGVELNFISRAATPLRKYSRWFKREKETTQAQGA